MGPSAPNHLNPDVIFLNQNCSKTWEVPDESLDVIFTSNFLEHLREKDQLKETILQAKRCLKKGGKIVCMGPNIKFLPYTMVARRHMPMILMKIYLKLPIVWPLLESSFWWSGKRFDPFRHATSVLESRK